MNEIWKSVPNFEQFYEVSNFGRVKSKEHYMGNLLIKSKILKLKPRKGDGYVRILLYKNTIKKSIYVHRLIATTFIKNPENKPHVNHKDGNKANNNIQNLEWVTRKENAEHAKEVLNVQVMGEKHYMTKFTKEDIIAIKKMREKGITLQEIANMYNVHNSTIGKIVTGINWKHIKIA